MAWIKTVAPAEAEGDLQEVYRAIASARGGIADVHRVQSLNPRALRARLRELGFDDRAILDATLTVGYFSFVNRLVLLLGVEIEAGFESTCKPEPEG